MEAKANALAAQGAGGIPGMPGPSGAAAPPPAELDLSRATTCLVLANMVKPNDTADAEMMGDILEDAREECAKHGAVTALFSPRPGAAGDAEALEASIRLRVYVQFASEEGAAACARALHGKLFDDLAIEASFAPPSLFTTLLSLPHFTAP